MASRLCLRAFWLERSLPASVTAPRLFLPLAREASIRRWEDCLLVWLLSRSEFVVMSVSLSVFRVWGGEETSTSFDRFCGGRNSGQVIGKVRVAGAEGGLAMFWNGDYG